MTDAREEEGEEEEEEEEEAIISFLTTLPGFNWEDAVLFLFWARRRGRTVRRVVPQNVVANERDCDAGGDGKREEAWNENYQVDKGIEIDGALLGELTPIQKLSLVLPPLPSPLPPFLPPASAALPSACACPCASIASPTTAMNAPTYKATAIGAVTVVQPAAVPAKSILESAHTSAAVSLRGRVLLLRGAHIPPQIALLFFHLLVLQTLDMPAPHAQSR